MKLSGMTSLSLQQNMVMEITPEQFAMFAKKTGLFSHGQVLSGKVVEQSGEILKLLIAAKGSEFILQAKADLHIGFQQNREVLFQVKYANQNYTLTPLFENLSMEQNAMKALEAAHLPQNENTMNMIGSLMKEGMPIDMNSLQETYQEVLRNMDASIMDIIDLHKLGVPVNTKNLYTLNAYKGGQHLLMEGMTEVVSQLAEAVEDFGNQLQTQKITFAENSGDVSIQMDNNAGIISKIFDHLLGIERDSMMQTSDLESVETMITSDGTLNLDNTNAGNGIPQQDVGNNQSVFEVLKESISSKGLSKEEQTMVLDFLKALEQMDEASLVKGFGNARVRSVFTDLVMEQFSLKPEKVSKEEVTKLYDKLSKQTKGLFDLLEGSILKDAPVTKSVQTMNQNLQFMNQLNTMYSYVQIPLKFSNQYQSGELVVYTNKRKLSQAEGEFSAFLRLNMKNLGQVDVHVALKDNRVKTNFVLEKEEMLMFINEHMDILNERLLKKGYQMQCKLSVKEKEIEEEASIFKMLERSTNRPTLVSYSFDVLA